MSNILNLVPKLAPKRSVKDILIQAVGESENTNSVIGRASKALLIFVNEDTNTYEVGYLSTDMKITECIMIAEIAKNLFMRTIK